MYFLFTRDIWGERREGSCMTGNTSIRVGQNVSWSILCNNLLIMATNNKVPKKEKVCCLEFTVSGVHSRGGNDRVRTRGSGPKLGSQLLHFLAA